MSANLTHIWDLRAATLQDNPSQWPTLAPEYRALLRPKNGIYTPQQVAILDGIAAARWFLLRNNGPHGERWRCKYCKQIHAFFSLSCLPVPLNGLTHTIGLLVERLPAEDVYSAISLGAIEPLTLPQAKILYEKLRDLGYTKKQLLGL